MRILWIAYNPLSVILKNLEVDILNFSGGWLEGGAERILANDDVELFYIFPYGEIRSGIVENLKYYTVRQIGDIKYRESRGYSKEDYQRFCQILTEIRPDIIHIYGTEKQFQRDYVKMCLDAGMINKTVVWIQGLVSLCSRCYGDGLSIKDIKRRTLWEYIRRTNVEGIKNRLELNGKDEIQVLKKLKNVFTRTEWDRAWCKTINPNLNIIECNETLRPAFYENVVWKIENVERHSIFLSQCNTPIKGFHMLLEAVNILKRQYPDIKVYTTGRNIFEDLKFQDKIRESSYTKIIREMIVKYDLKDNVIFKGRLSSYEMREEYLKANVSVVPSSIENSPNSLGEAMILGVPVVAADVGGVSSMMTHESEGLLYPFHESALLAEYISKIFNDDKYAYEISKKSRARALKTHNIEKNYDDLIRGYRKILELSMS